MGGYGHKGASCGPWTITTAVMRSDRSEMVTTAILNLSTLPHSKRLAAGRRARSFTLTLKQSYSIEIERRMATVTTPSLRSAQSAFFRLQGATTIISMPSSDGDESLAK